MTMSSGDLEEADKELEYDFQRTQICTYLWVETQESVC